MRKTMGETIAENRKAKGMTQLELAQKLGVTDKAVSKWERNLSCPDIGSLPQLAEALGLSVETLLQGNAPHPPSVSGRIPKLALKSVGLSMGIAVTVLTSLNALEPEDGMRMLGIGLACLAATLLDKKPDT